MRCRCCGRSAILPDEDPSWWRIPDTEEVILRRSRILDEMEPDVAASRYPAGARKDVAGHDIAAHRGLGELAVHLTDLRDFGSGGIDDIDRALADEDGQGSIGRHDDALSIANDVDGPGTAIDR
jgi:hypothetical protein